MLYSYAALAHRIDFGAWGYVFLFSTGVSLGGSACWCFHFVGMHAMRVETCTGAVVGYEFDAAWTFASLVIACVGCMLGSCLLLPGPLGAEHIAGPGERKEGYVDRREPSTAWLSDPQTGKQSHTFHAILRVLSTGRARIRCAGAAWCFAVSLCGMHYCGNMGMHGSFVMECDYGLVFASFVIGLISSAFLATFLAYASRVHRNDVDSLVTRICCAAALACGLNAMHYVGLRAVNLRAIDEMPERNVPLSGMSVSISPFVLAIICSFGNICQLTACQHVNTLLERAQLRLDKLRMEYVNCRQRAKLHLSPREAFAYPMALLSYARLRACGSFQPHEELRDSGDLRFMDSATQMLHFMGVRTVVFVSHQWLGIDEPDRNGVQYQTCILALDRLAVKLGVPPDELYIWMDYMSIPQRNSRLQQAAVNDLPLYAAQSHALLVVAPTAKSERGAKICDFASYARRGWCRAEIAAKFIGSGNAANIFLADSSLHTPGGDLIRIELPEHLESSNEAVAQSHAAVVKDSSRDTSSSGVRQSAQSSTSREEHGLLACAHAGPSSLLTNPCTMDAALDTEAAMGTTPHTAAGFQSIIVHKDGAPADEAARPQRGQADVDVVRQMFFIFDGEFSCCERDHLMDGVPIACDKKRLHESAVMLFGLVYRNQRFPLRTHMLEHVDKIWPPAEFGELEFEAMADEVDESLHAELPLGTVPSYAEVVMRRACTSPPASIPLNFGGRRRTYSLSSRSQIFSPSPDVNRRHPPSPGMSRLSGGGMDTTAATSKRSQPASAPPLNLGIPASASADSPQRSGRVYPLAAQRFRSSGTSDPSPCRCSDLCSSCSSVRSRPTSTIMKKALFAPETDEDTQGRNGMGVLLHEYSAAAAGRNSGVVGSSGRSSRAGAVGMRSAVLPSSPPLVPASGSSPTAGLERPTQRTSRSKSMLMAL